MYFIKSGIVGICLISFLCLIGCGNGEKNPISSSSSNSSSSGALSTVAILVIGSCWERTWVPVLGNYLESTAIISYSPKSLSCTFGTLGEITYLQNNVNVGEYQYIVFDSLTDIDLSHPNMMTTPIQYTTNLQEIVNLIYAVNAKPIFVDMPGMVGDPSHPLSSIQQYNNLSIPLMQKINVPIADAYQSLFPYGNSAWIDPTDYYLLNSLGNSIVAQTVGDAIGYIPH